MAPVSSIAFLSGSVSPCPRFLYQNAASLRSKRSKCRIMASSRERDRVPSGPPSVGEDPVKEDGELKYERLFSTLNEATLKHEPGSLSSAILLVAGTTIGAGILAIPAVTRDSGFLASSVTCTICWIYMVATGLLVAEVNVSTMCELGSGGVSIVSMAQRTLGTTGVRLASAAYMFIHYTLLVAYVSRSADIMSNALGTPLCMA